MRCNRKVPPYWLVLQAQLSEFESEISECKYTWTYFTWYDVITTSKMQKQIYVFMCPSWDRNKENISVIEEINLRGFQERRLSIYCGCRSSCFSQSRIQERPSFYCIARWCLPYSSFIILNSLHTYVSRARFLATRLWYGVFFCTRFSF